MVLQYKSQVYTFKSIFAKCLKHRYILWWYVDAEMQSLCHTYNCNSVPPLLSLSDVFSPYVLMYFFIHTFLHHVIISQNANETPCHTLMNYQYHSTSTKLNP